MRTEVYTMKKTPLLIIGIAFLLIGASSRAAITDFHNYPNPFAPDTDPTTFVLTLNPSSVFKTATLTIYNAVGKVVYEEDEIATGVIDKGDYYEITQWRGVDLKGNQLPKALYHAKIEVRTTDGDVLFSFADVIIK
jgi:flagellar hook assembly protein FlgD